MTTFMVKVNRGLMEAREEFDTRSEARAAARMANRMGGNFSRGTDVTVWHRSGWVPIDDEIGGDDD